MIPSLQSPYNKSILVVFFARNILFPFKHNFLSLHFASREWGRTNQFVVFEFTTCLNQLKIGTIYLQKKTAIIVHMLCHSYIYKYYMCPFARVNFIILITSNLFFILLISMF